MFNKIKNTIIYMMLLLQSQTITASAPDIIPVAVIGSGCAGLAAAFVTSEEGFETVIFSGPIKGGDLNVKTEVGNWLGVKTSLGNDIMPNVIDTAQSYGAKIIHSNIHSVDFHSSPFKLVDSNGTTYYAHKVIIATGTTDRMLTTPGALENRAWLLYNYDIHNKHGVENYRASTKGKKVIVIGGGIDAMKKAAYAAFGGAKEVRLLVRGESLKMPPWRKRFLDIRQGVVKIEYHSNIQKIDKQNNMLQVTTNHGTYDADIVVVSIGRTPRSELFKQYVKTDANGFIVIDSKTHATSVAGIYACGDVTDSSGPQPQALIAVGNGMAAGYSVVEELLKMNLPQKDVFFTKIRSSVKGILSK